MTIKKKWLQTMHLGKTPVSRRPKNTTWFKKKIKKSLSSPYRLQTKFYQHCLKLHPTFQHIITPFLCLSDLFHPPLFFNFDCLWTWNAGDRSLLRCGHCFASLDPISCILFFCNSRLACLPSWVGWCSSWPGWMVERCTGECLAPPKSDAVNPNPSTHSPMVLFNMLQHIWVKPKM